MSKLVEAAAKYFADAVHMKDWGQYPEGYNPAQHGPFNPAQYYGKPDTPFGQVKLNDLQEWFKRRDCGFKQTMSLISRTYWRWNLKYCQPKKAGTAAFYQIAVFGLILGYSMNYLRIRGHRHYKYH